MSEAKDQAYVRLNGIWYCVPGSVYGRAQFPARCGEVTGIVRVGEVGWQRAKVACRIGRQHAIAPTSVLERAGVNGEAVDMKLLDMRDYDEGNLVNALDTAALLAGCA